MARNYITWNNTRGNSSYKLEERPHVTNNVNGTKRYYSSVDAEIYFGNIFIDEVTSITWSIQQQAMPIFGYNSYTFDDVAVGSRLVQGQFAVNFTKAGYLKQLQEDSEFTRIARKLYGKDLKADSYFTQDYRRRLNMPVWDNGFDIVIGFGDQGKSTSSLENNMYQTYAILDCCQITGSMVQLDYNGEPVQEVYTFIARDIKYKKATEGELNPPNDNGTDKDYDVNRPTSYTYIGVLDLANGAIKITANEKANLNSAVVTVMDDVDDKSLKNPITLGLMPGGELSASLSKDKVKAFKTEINKNSMTQIKVKAQIKYLGVSSTSTEHSLKTDNTTLFLTIKS